jgi:hypothetical protein
MKKKKKKIPKQDDFAPLLNIAVLVGGANSSNQYGNPSKVLG